MYAVCFIQFLIFGGTSCGCRGEKAFCSSECRKCYIEEEIEEEAEELMILDHALNL